MVLLYIILLFVILAMAVAGVGIFIAVRSKDEEVTDEEEGDWF